MRRCVLTAVLALYLIPFAGAALAREQVTVAGVEFPKQMVVEGRTLHLNGVAVRKALGFIKVYVAGLYLENPTTDSHEIIVSEQVKHLVTHYLSGLATAKKLREGFIDLMETCNPPEMFERNKADIERYASWLDKDMQPGLTSVSTYVPGKGLTLEYQGQIRGTIANPEFAWMYYSYNVGEDADAKIREGFLGGN